MTIKVGDRLPNATFRVMTADGPKPKTTDEVFKGKKVVLFAVPGAFTPTCHKNHLPGFVKNAAAIKAKGVDAIAVTGVNDRLRDECLEEVDRRRRRSSSWPTATAISPRRSASTLDGSAGGLGIALPALLHGGRRRRRQVAQRRGRARQGRHLRRRRLLKVAARSSDRLASRALSGIGFVISRFESRARSGDRRMPSRASSSARSFSAGRHGPCTQCQSTSCAPSARVEPLPQIDVLDRLLVGGVPAVASSSRGSSSMMPSRTYWLSVWRSTRAGPLQRLQRRDRRHQLHAVVGGLRLAAGQLLARGRPNAGSRPSRRGRDCPSRRRRCRSMT